MDGTDLRYFVERLRLALPEARLSRDDQRQSVPGAAMPWHLAAAGRSRHVARKRPGRSPACARPAPMAARSGWSCSGPKPRRSRLLPMLDRSNRDKSRLAPVVAILAHDVEFWRRLDRLHPHADAAAWFRDDPVLCRETAFRNGSLQAAYFIFATSRLGCRYRCAVRLRRETGSGRHTSPGPPSRSTLSAISAMVIRPPSSRACRGSTSRRSCISPP